METSARPRRILLFVFLPLCLAGLMALSWETRFVRDTENFTLDWRFQARAASDPAPDPRIALVGIGDFSLAHLGRWQDWSRDTYGKFLEVLRLRPPVVVAFDLFFSEPSASAESDEVFAHWLSSHPSSITGMVLKPRADNQSAAQAETTTSIGKTRALTRVSGDPRGVLSATEADLPIPLIAESAYTGSVNFSPSGRDGIRRRLPLVVRLGETVYPSFVLQILMQLEGADPDAVEVVLGDAIRIPRREGGIHRIPIDRDGLLPLNYRNTARLEIEDFAMIMVQILRTETQGEAWPEGVAPIRDQIVIVGQSAVGLSDFGTTPYSTPERPLDPLFLVQSTALDSILREDYLRDIPARTAVPLWFGLALLTLFGLRTAPIWLAIALPLALAIGAVSFAFWIFAQASLAVPLVLPTLGFLLVHAVVISERLVTERREKRYLRSVFGTYVSPAVVEQIVSSGELPKLGGEKVDITVLFSDIQGFSTFSEKLGPEALVDLMVEYLSAMTDIVMDEGGTLDKYIGDAIDAMFGAPLPLPGHARHAVETTIRMQRLQEALRERWSATDLPDLVKRMRTRIGLNTGPAVVGNIGSQRRFNYTMMGDTVNLGARCESGAKAYGVYTMVTGETVAAARATQDDVVYRLLDRIVVQGRTLPVEVYEVVETKDLVADSTFECLDRYAAALSAYIEADWERALEAFVAASPLEFLQPDPSQGIATNPSLVMAHRCRNLLKSPPESWDGIYRMTTK